MAASLVRAGIQVDIVTTDDDGAGRMIRPGGGVASLSPHVTAYYHPRQTRFYTFSWPLTRWLAQHIRDYDLVHIHALFTYPVAPAAYYAHRAGVPYVVRPLGTLNQWGMLNRHRMLKRASFRLIERRILAGAAAIQFTSAREQREARKLGIDDRSVVISLGMDLSEFETLPPSHRFSTTHPRVAGQNVVLYLSRLDPVKGLDVLLPAFQRVQQRLPDTILVLAGNGEESFVQGLHTHAERLGIASRIIWTGFLSGDQKREAYAAATVYVLPSYSENFGVAAVEAIASGLPVILSEGVGIAADVEAAGAGLVVPSSVDALAESMERCLTDAHLRRQLGTNARQLARAQFSTQSTGPQLVQLYEQILRHRIGTAMV
jgi:glycosyltransferase involved in cell wall biosynthesis